ncbi:hypothetical protein AGDE_12796 [Angomonas deanei]|uniref:Uncharacterized protein n=1 Tax=Angomonas deanei TaxID=59799 RepID=A0A7G2CCU7_9TRYP|nr:hypothetical protein AGDE_12796 [Angomonas deanei]CAD2216684.1 hypothetical protein, conserved [Angomonas deanei]|eukprot:EPY23560.1 hypothetical protein AGDE_12796 [Angomonas deanei]
MSFSETLSALIRREYKRLNSVGCGKRSKSLRASISRGIERITRVANIVLQVANQLIENSEDPEVLGVARKISDNEKIRKNPVNKLPTIEDGSVNYFLAYEVLFQLQMLGTNISYIVSAYRKALEIPLKDLPDQHVAFCRELCDEVQGVTKEVNVLVQSAIDGRYKKDGSPRKTRHSRKHRSTRKTRSSSESSSDSDSSSTSSSSPLARSRRRSSVSSDDSDASSGSSSTDSSKSTPVRRKKSGYSDDFSSSSSSGSSSSTSSSSSRSLNSYKVSPKRTTLLDPVPRVVSTGILTPTPVSPLPVSPHSTPQQALSVPQVPITPTLSGGGFGLSNPSLTPPAPNLGSSLPLAVPLPTASPMHNQPAPQLSLNTSLPLNTPPPPPNDNNNPTSTYNLLSTFHFGGSSSSSPSGSRQPSLVPAPQPPTSSSFGLPAVPPPLSPTAVQTSAVYNNDI